MYTFRDYFAQKETVMSEYFALPFFAEIQSYEKLDSLRVIHTQSEF